MTETQHTYKILVVDDEPDLEHLMRQRLRREVRSGRYELHFAQNGVEALERLKEVPGVYMVLTDINMPRMDGLTLLGEISNISPDLRAVVVSAYGDMKNIRTAMNRGAFDFVTKPIDFQDLRVTIERTLKSADEWYTIRESQDRLVKIQNELNVASDMQQSILPTMFPQSDHCDIFGNMESAREVGGDFYDVFSLPDGRIGLAIADVSDKGVPAALFMMSSRILMKGSAIGAMNPGTVLKEVNNLLSEENEKAMFVTAFYSVYTPDSGNLHYANGGHNPPLIIHPDGATTLLPNTNGIALGVFPDLEFDESDIRLSAGDLLVLYTDGVTEAMNADGEEFGMDRLEKVFSESRPDSTEAATSAIFDAVHDFAGETPQSDDITCITVLQK